MVQMAPNNSAVTAIIHGMETYTVQENFYVLQLEITSSKKVENTQQLPGAEKGKKIKALLSKENADDLKLKKGMEVSCEIRKVSPELWRVGTIKKKK